MLLEAAGMMWFSYISPRGSSACSCCTAVTCAWLMPHTVQLCTICRFSACVWQQTSAFSMSLLCCSLMRLRVALQLHWESLPSGIQTGNQSILCPISTRPKFQPWSRLFQVALSCYVTAVTVCPAFNTKRFLWNTFSRYLDFVPSTMPGYCLIIATSVRETPLVCCLFSLCSV